MTTIGTMYSGGEGVGVGARAAGLAHAWGVEYDDAIAGVARLNGFRTITASAVDVDYSALPPVDILHASPPCPNFSVAKTGAKETAHDRALSDAVSRALRAIRPRVFTLENVRGYAGSESLRAIGQTLADLDYSVDQWVLNSADFGVPQTRERLVLVARAGGWMRSPLQLPRPVPWVGWYAAIEDLIPTLPESRFAEWQLKRLPENLKGAALHQQSRTADRGPGVQHREQIDPAYTVDVNGAPPKGFIVPDANDSMAARCGHEPVFTLTTSTAPGRAFLLSSSATEYGDGLRDADEPALATTAQHGGRLRTVLVNEDSKMGMADDGERGFTVVSSERSGRTRAWLAAGRVVAMTPRCLARFQSFPDTYVLPERNSLACRVIGNAVPPLLYQRVIEAVMEQP